MPKFTLEGGPDKYTVLGLDGKGIEEVSLEKQITEEGIESWAFIYKNQGEVGYKGRVFDSKMTALCEIGLRYNVTYEQKMDRLFADLVNSLADKLRPYKALKSKTHQDTGHKKTEEEMTRDILSLKGKLNLLCLKSETGHMQIVFQDGESDKRHPVSIADFIVKPFGAIVQDAQAALETDKLFLGALDSLSLVFDTPSKTSACEYLDGVVERSEEIVSMFEDVIYGGLIDKPLLNLRDPKRLSFIASETIEGLLKANRDMRAEIQAYDDDMTGIHLILQDESALARAMLPVFQKWEETFPLVRLLQLDELDEVLGTLEVMTQQQRIKEQHQGIIEHLGEALTRAVETAALPNNIQELLEQRLLQEGDQEEINAKLFSLVDTAKAAIKGQLQAIMFSEAGHGWVTLVPEEPALDNLMEMVLAHHFILEVEECFNARDNIKPLGEVFKEKLEELKTQQLTDYTAKQQSLEAIYDAEGREYSQGEAERLSEFEVKHPTSRRTLDTRELADASLFQSILIGAIYLEQAYKGGNLLDMNGDIQEFVKEKCKADPAYLDKAKEACLCYLHQFGPLDLMHERLIQKLEGMGLGRIAVPAIEASKDNGGDVPYPEARFFAQQNTQEASPETLHQNKGPGSPPGDK
jgi:hypothetical protein